MHMLAEDLVHIANVLHRRLLVAAQLFKARCQLLELGLLKDPCPKLPAGQALR